MVRSLICVAVALLAFVSTAHAQPNQQTRWPPGAAVSLAGTPHLWVAGDDGVLHWAGDTRALAGRYVNWSNRTELTLAQLRLSARTGPWLSAGLLKLGDPIYFVKWETGEPAPTLLHIQSIADVELFGIDAGNYGALVLDQARWEARYGIAVGGLRRGVLAGAVATPTPTPVRTPTPFPTAIVTTATPVLPSCSDVLGSAIFRNPGVPGSQTSPTTVNQPCDPTNRSSSASIFRVYPVRVQRGLYVDRYGGMAGTYFETPLCLEPGLGDEALYDANRSLLIFTGSRSTCTVTRLYR